MNRSISRIQRPGKGGLILASASPRRKQVLQNLGIEFDVVAPEVQETWNEADDPARVAVELAERKAASVADSGQIVLAMDTIVAIGREKLGKPETEEDARRMLDSLSGRMHSVITGVALRQGRKTVSGAETTHVYFRRLSAPEIDWYIKTGEPSGKAGAYAIQGFASLFVDRIEGCYFNVVGFPVGKFQILLAEMGLNIYQLIQRTK